jgi:DnaA family protein
MPISPQLPLPLHLNPQATFDSFVAGPNIETVAWLRTLATTRDEPVTFLWGPSGCGRSHLLQATCREVSQAGQRSVYLPLATAKGSVVSLLEGVEHVRLTCLDDIETIAGNDTAERAAFALCNRLRESGGQLLVAGTKPPAELALELPDLRSRLGWGPVFGLRVLDDDSKLRVLGLRAAQLGFELPEEAGRYLLARSARGLNQLLHLLDGIDRATLVAQRRVTIPFLRDYLAAAD